MESPKEDSVTMEDDAAAAAATLDSSPVQESPFSNYLNNLSPIKPIKAANVGLHGMNSCPLVFTLPTVKLQPRADQLKRNQMFEYSEDARKDDPVYSSQKSKEFVTQSGNVSVGLDEEFPDSKDSLTAQPCSSSHIVDSFLADPVETDCDCADSTRLSGGGAHGDRRKSNSCFDCEVDAPNGFGKKASDIQLVSPEQTNPEAGKLLTCDGPTRESEEYQVAEPSFSNRCKVVTSDLPKDGTENQVDIRQVFDIKEGSHLNASFDHVQHLYDSLPDSEANEGHGVSASEGLIMLADTHRHEEMQHQRFLLRRCLRFDDVLLDVSSNPLGSPSSIINSPGSLSMEELEKLDMSGIHATFMKTPVNKLSRAATPVIRKSSSMTTNKNSGIGLHLNSIVGARPTGAGTCNTLDISTSSSHCAEPRKFTEAKERYVTPLDKSKSHLTLADAEFIQTSPKRRRKVSNTPVGDGCKRCSCRKSRCLKLYCDCFAAGLFCSEPCTCQGCLNRHEEKEAVLAAREQIESRNPLAFAPKIVQSDKELAATDREDGNWSTPSSARHKRGCNCKRSMCQKKYCECYQANVGCSDNCRCEGCMNVFGTKEDFLVARDMASSSIGEASLEVKSNVKLAMGMTCSRDHLMPPTPSFQFSDNRKGFLRSRLATKRTSPNSSAKSGSGLSRAMHFEGSQESPALVSVTDFLDRKPRSSLCRHRSPETTGIGPGCDNSRRDHEPWKEIYGILYDDTPEVLKDASSPARQAIVRSPSRKRVSSPHKQIGEHCLSSSTALRSGGKFVLKGVPSFPRLTPSSKSDGQP